jgi:hypothetical protein
LLVGAVVDCVVIMITNFDLGVVPGGEVVNGMSLRAQLISLRTLFVELSILPVHGLPE